MSHFRQNWDTLKYPARDRTNQDTEKTHAALERVEDRGQSPRHNSTLPWIGHPISLSAWPVAGRSTCAYDNNMHTDQPTADGKYRVDSSDQQLTSGVNWKTARRERGVDTIDGFDTVCKWGVRVRARGGLAQNRLPSTPPLRCCQFRQFRQSPSAVLRLAFYKTGGSGVNRAVNWGRGWSA